jgi:hypothetical protein
MFLANDGHRICRLLQVNIHMYVESIDCCHLFLVLLQIIELMADPSTENPVMPAIAQQILQNPQEFYDTARKYTAKHAQLKGT